MFGASSRSMLTRHPETTIISCACGCQYSRREVHLPIKDIGYFECVDCGKRLEIWSGRTVPVFTRIAHPQSVAKSA